MASKVLIADDNALFRKTLRHILETAQLCEVIEARDGYEALTQSRVLHPEIVVLDLAMPVMDGLRAAREITKSLPGVPILMCTMHASTQLDRDAKDAGVHKVIPKVQSNLIVPEIEKLLRAKTSISGTTSRTVTPEPAKSPPVPAISLPPEPDGGPSGSLA